MSSVSQQGAGRAAPTVCLLTPLGVGGLAAVRLFGPGTGELLDRLFVPDRPGVRPADPARLALGRLMDPHTGEPIDQAILRLLGGDRQAGLGAELTLHGGVRIVQRAVAACESLGVRRLDASRPGDREELWQQSRLLAEAAGTPRPALWADVELALPRARTRAVAEWIVGQWSVGLARYLGSLQAEALNDKQGSDRLGDLLAGYPARGRTIDGVRVAIVGPANAGKSTLFNALAGDDAAIVSDQPGTTRDYVTRWVNLAGLPAELIDTAGLPSPPALPALPAGGVAASELELQAAALAEPVVRAADLRLIVLDNTRRPGGAELAALDGLARLGPAVWVVNKSDLPRSWRPGEVWRRCGPAAEGVEVSAALRRGLDELARAVRAWFGVPDMSPAAPGLFADRQAALVESALHARGPARAALLGEVA